MMLPAPAPAERRYRTRTDQLAPFWAAHARFYHDPNDLEIQRAEWSGLGLDPIVLGALRRAGLGCYRLVPACPDWLLGSIRGLGPTRLRELRRILPYGRDVFAGPLCPGRQIELDREKRQVERDGVRLLTLGFEGYRATPTSWEGARDDA